MLELSLQCLSIWQGPILSGFIAIFKILEPFIVDFLVLAVLPADHNLDIK